jgi:GH24 family phage-related lysozyme (muramidase)
VIPKRAIDLILQEEGVDQPGKWPGGRSGITIGYGYDLGFEPHFEQDWTGKVAQAWIDRLKQAIGLRGQSARVIAHRFDDIRIPEPVARDVFINRNLPREEKATLDAFPGSQYLTPNAFGALVSIVFNRGPGMIDDPARPKDQTRREMREIRDLLKVCVATQAAPPELPGKIAAQIRSMKRLWVGKGLAGLLSRREHEAQLVEAAA